MVIGAYFDESIRQEGEESICVGGYLFKPSQYVRFRQRWHREVLRLPDRRQLRYFRMADICAGQGVCAGLDIPTRMGVLKRAVDVVGDCAYGAVGVHFLQAEFVALAPPDFAKYRGSIYSQACGMIPQVTAFRLREWGCGNMEVLYVFERGHKFQSEANDILGAMARDPRAVKQFKYRHMFEEKEREYGLQAADLFAWRHDEGALNQRRSDPPRFQAVY